MRNRVLAICLWVTCTGSLVGQVRASMSPPILKTGPEEISFTTRFSHFAGGSDYRLGVGTTGDEMNNAKFELSKGDTVLSKELVSFRQGFASAYFEVDRILVQGFLFSSDDLPDEGEEITLKVTIPRAEAEKLKRLFIIIATQFGPDRWYIMDGGEINESHW